MLLELAIGDAYGAGFEFAPRSKIQKYNNLRAYQMHGLGMPAGSYTDDTQMSLALSELLIEQLPWTKANIVHKFISCYQRDPRLGYSSGFQSFLDSVYDEQDFLLLIDPQSRRNGAAMRAAPIGIIEDISQLLHFAQLQAKLTHNTPEGIQSAQAIALAAHFFIYQLGSKKELLDFIRSYTDIPWHEHWVGQVPCEGVATVNAILTLIKQADSLEQILWMGVELGGDVDTITAITLAIAAQSTQFNPYLPEFLSRDLENGPYGRDYLVKIGQQLFCLKNQAFPKNVMQP